MPQVTHSEPINVAVIGVGHLGKIHARILAQNPAARLACVVDVDLARARGIAGEHGCQAYGDPRELPAGTRAAIVAVPTIFHARVAIPLLERGIAVLVEKPLASSLEEGRAILSAARQSGAILSVGHVERFQPGLRKVRALGMRPRFVESHRLAPFSFRSMDVGVVHDLMIHDLDLVLDLVGSDVVSVDCAGGAILTAREDVASARLIFSNGARANVTASRASLKPLRRMRLFSSEGYVSLDFSENHGLLVKKGPRWQAGRAELARLEPAALGANAGDWMKSGILEVEELDLGGEQRPLQAELNSFLEAVRGEHPVEVSGEDGLRALELAERIASAIATQDAHW